LEQPHVQGFQKKFLLVENALVQELEVLRADDVNFIQDEEIGYEGKVVSQNARNGKTSKE
jgi:hypothetical protein